MGAGTVTSSHRLHYLVRVYHKAGLKALYVLIPVGLEQRYGLEAWGLPVAESVWFTVSRLHF